MENRHAYPVQIKLIYELKVLVHVRVIFLTLLLLLIHIETLIKYIQPLMS